MAVLNRALACRSVVEPRTLVRDRSGPTTADGPAWVLARRSRKFVPPIVATRMTGEGRLMKFWQNNRLDGTFETSTEQIVAQFRASTWWTADLDSAVRGFFIDSDGPVKAVWDDERDLAEVRDRARAAGWAGAVSRSHTAAA